MTITKTWDVLAEAHHALTATVAGVPESDWGLRTPCEQWNVTQVLQHAVGDQLAYAAAITGGPGPVENPFAPNGIRPAQPQAFLEAALHTSAEAWSTVEPTAESVPTPLPQGALSTTTAVGAAALDAVVHAWDIAVATGQPSPLGRSLAEHLMPVALDLVEPLRAYGAYAPALEAEPGDDAVAALLRYLGRNPEWAR
jgi:uncharacterized protein (TIGR03086 family)